jgi:adenine-specific DNA-methyltransferase
MKKTSGSYYTPDALADFLVFKALHHVAGAVSVRVLEPSCGDGSVLKALKRNGDDRKFQIDAVELRKAAIKKIKSSMAGDPRTLFYNCDFLYFNPGQTYRLAIGNPPYVRRKLLTCAQRECCREIHRNANLKDSTINNIWSAFLVKCTQHLAPDGVLAFILPAELLQVKFAQEIQTFLKAHFQRIEIYTFKEIVFDDLGQDIIALIACKSAAEPGIYFGSVEELASAKEMLQPLKRSKSVEASDIKWAGHILSDDDSAFLLDVSSKVNAVSHYCDSCAGIVTAANDFFVISKKMRRKFALSAFCKPIVQRGQFVNGSVVFDSMAFKKLMDDGKPCYLLDVNGKKLKDLSKSAQKYISHGRTRNIHKRFKCTKRKRWCDVPSVWGSHAFFFKRSHLYPKLLLNTANVLVTDAAYRVSVTSPFSVNSFVFSFYNSLTLAMAELRGRFYGGGVLELTPNEFKSLPIPYVEINDSDFDAFQRRFKSADTIQKTLQENDKMILGKCLNLTAEQIVKLQDIRRQLVERRIRGTC